MSRRDKKGDKAGVFGGFEGLSMAAGDSCDSGSTLGEDLQAPSLTVSEVRYIKLGSGRKWADEAIRRGIIPLDYRGVDHSACARGDWEEVRQQLMAMGRQARAMKDDERELKEFYQLGPDTLWFTIVHAHVWWAFADGEVVEGDRGDANAPPRFRKVRTPWRNTSLNGSVLSERSFSSALTSIAAYQRTICSVREADYLLQRIQGNDDPLRSRADRLLGELTRTTTEMVRRLDWQDFETLVDLIFAYSGYKRRSAIGGAQADIDFVAEHPLTGQGAWVQVKSSATQAVFDNYLERFRREANASEFFFVYHSAKQPIRLNQGSQKIHVWSADAVAKAAVEAGLLRWIKERIR